jgi:cytochrome c oxidase subunit 1
MLYFPFLVLGYLGMPRRYYDYLPEYQPLHVIATVGSWVLVLGVLILVVNLLVSLRRGAPAPANPWGGLTLEWQVSSPPPADNFETIPVVTHGPYDFGTVGAPGGEKP